MFSASGFDAFKDLDVILSMSKVLWLSASAWARTAFCKKIMTPSTVRRSQKKRKERQDTSQIPELAKLVINKTYD